MTGRDNDAEHYFLVSIPFHRFLSVPLKKEKVAGGYFNGCPFYYSQDLQPTEEQVH